MNYLTWEITAPERPGGNREKESAKVTGYVLDWGVDGKKKVRPAVVVCPGGGYRFVSPREGEPIAMEYLSMGYHVFVLEYTVAPARFPTALWQLGLLMAQIREHSREWAVDPDKIVVTGFSAGAHLACSLGVFWNREFVFEPIGRKPEEIRPAGMILSYPVITSGPYCHAGSFENLLGEEADQEEKRELVSLEKQVSCHTPKTFLWHTAADEIVPVQNSLLLAEALVNNGVGLEMHIYPSGCHGLSLATEDTSAGDERRIEPRCQSWIKLAGEWLANL